MTLGFARRYLDESARIAADLDSDVIERMAALLAGYASGAGACSFSEWAAAPHRLHTP